jgi:hypothetical protein
VVSNPEGRTCGVFEIRVLRGIFGPKGEEETGDWRMLHEEESYTLYFSPSRVMCPDQGGLDGWGMQHAWGI